MVVANGSTVGVNCVVMPLLMGQEVKQLWIWGYYLDSEGGMLDITSGSVVTTGR